VAYEALGAALFLGKRPQELSGADRRRTAHALRAGVRLREELLAAELKLSPKRKVDEHEKETLASSHFRLSQVLGTSPDLADDPEHKREHSRQLWEEALLHMRAAVRLSPKKYKKQAQTLRKFEKQQADEARAWEEAGKSEKEQQKKLREADPVAVAKAAEDMRRKHEKEMQEEEDRALQEEEEREEAAGIRAQPRVPKYPPTKVADDDDAAGSDEATGADVPGGGSGFGTDTLGVGGGEASKRASKLGAKERRRKASTKFNLDGTPKHDEL